MIVHEFQQYQIAFTAHLRDPAKNKKPDRVNAKRMKVYTEIVFNNLESTVSACFPVTKKVLGKRQWLKLVRGFFANHQSKTPIFREIPQEFLKYIETLESIPPYLKSLAHYEWVELAVSILDVVADASMVNPAGNLLDEYLVFAPAMMLLEYNYPVQIISPRYKPTQILDQPVHLIVYRDTLDDVKFIELNAQTALMLKDLQHGNHTARQWLMSFASQYKELDANAIVDFGAVVLQSLQFQQLILGTRASNLIS